MNNSISNFIGLGCLIISPLIGYQIYRYYKKYADYENFTKNNNPKEGIEYFGNLEEKPSGKKRVKFNSVIEEFYFNDE